VATSRSLRKEPIESKRSRPISDLTKKSKSHLSIKSFKTDEPKAYALEGRKEKRE